MKAMSRCLMAWLRSFWQQPAQPELEPVEPEKVKAPALVKSRRKRGELQASLSGLLDNLEKTFVSLSRATDGGSCTVQSLRKGLKLLGPYVPVSPTYTSDTRIIITPETKFPALMLCALNFGDDSDGEWMYPDFIYARKVQSLPWMVERLRGTPYECGGAWRTSRNKLWWVGFFVVVDQNTGQVTACHELQNEIVRVRPGVEYVRRVWAVSACSDSTLASDGQRDAVLASNFAGMFRFWQEKDSMWTVGVRRKNERVTFCVPDNDAKTYFRDRDKTALTSAGKRRPIIHFVRSHERKLVDDKVTQVREHIRGLRTFDWQGFMCAITAPKWHRWNTSAFELSSVDPDDYKPRTKIIDAAHIGGWLADAEDSQTPPRFSENLKRENGRC